MSSAPLVLGFKHWIWALKSGSLLGDPFHGGCCATHESTLQDIVYVGMAVRTALSMVNLPALERKREDQLEARCLIRWMIENVHQGFTGVRGRAAKHHGVVGKQQVIHSRASSRNSDTSQSTTEFCFATQARQNLPAQNKDIWGDWISLSYATVRDEGRLIF